MNVTATPPAREPQTGNRTELARYTVPNGGERILYGQRTVNGKAIRIDIPAGEQGRVYLVERGLEQDGNAALQALISDYLQQSTNHAEIPMVSSRAVDRYLHHLDHKQAVVGPRRSSVRSSRCRSASSARYT